MAVTPTGYAHIVVVCMCICVCGMCELGLPLYDVWCDLIFRDAVLFTFCFCIFFEPVSVYRLVTWKALLDLHLAWPLHMHGPSVASMVALPVSAPPLAFGGLRLL